MNIFVKFMRYINNKRIIIQKRSFFVELIYIVKKILQIFKKLLGNFWHYQQNFKIIKFSYNHFIFTLIWYQVIFWYNGILRKAFGDEKFCSF